MGPQDTTQSDWEDNLLDYLFGAMPPDEAARFERGLIECQEHVALAQRYTQVIGVLGTAVPPAEPPDGHKDRFMARLAVTPQERPASGLAGDSTEQPARMPGLTVVAGPTLAGETPQPAPRPLPSDGAEKPAPVDIAAARQERTRTSWAIAVASVAAALALFFGVWAFILNSNRGSGPIAPGYEALVIQPQGEYTSTAVVLFNRDTLDAHFYSSNLQPLPPDKVYELWLLPAQGDPVPAGVFTGDPAGRATHLHTADRPLRNYVGFAVTIENAPGTRSPEGPIIMAGTFQ
jgi:anti-sigma-K factor RskA